MRRELLVMAMRNRIVHGYWEISTSILLATAQDDMPGFLEAAREVESALRQTPPEEQS